MSNRENLSLLFLQIHKSLAKVASTIVPPKEIEDIVQEAYVRICEISNEAPIHSPRSFLYRVVRNLALDYVKRSETKLSNSIDDEEVQLLLELMDDDSTFHGAASKEEFELFCKAVRQLPIQCRRVFILKKVYGYSQKEIALDLHISESTVEKHIAFGIKRCWHFMNFHLDNSYPSGAGDYSAKEIHYE